MKTKPFLLGCLLVAGLVPAQTAQFGDFTYDSDGSAVTITGYSGSGGEVTIPETIQGLPVTKIYDRAFKGRTQLTRVTIPDSVTSIGGGAFYGCVTLTSVVIGNSDTQIGSSAFGGCERLTYAQVGSGAMLFRRGPCPVGAVVIQATVDGLPVTHLGDYIFSGCTGLTGVVIPDSVTSIGGQAFEDCRGLTSITIPDSVTSIGRSAFRGCTGLTSITIPDSVTSIGEWAFYGCTGLTSITIPDSVTSIGSSAFGGCTSLTSITIPNSVTRIGWNAFSRCTGLTNVVIGIRVTSIGNQAFSGCTGLTSIMIPDSVTSIEFFAFSYCSMLRAVYFGGDRPLTGERPFAGCSPTLRVYYRPGTSGWGLTFWGRLTAPWVLLIHWQPGHVLFHANKPAAVDMGLSAIPPAACQWYMNAVPLEGATNASLRLPVVTAAHEAWYTLVATNPMGSVTSRPVAALVSNVDPHVRPVLAWPGDPVNPITLQAAESVTGSWSDRQDYPAAAGGQGYVEPDGTAAALFYRLKGAGPVAFAATGRVNGWWFEEAAGSQHRIEYVSPTAGWTQWQVLTNLTLPSSPYLFVDHASQAEPERAYRVTPVP